MMDKAQHNERPTDIVLTGTWREEVSETSLRRNLKNLALWGENLCASHEGKKLPASAASPAATKSSAAAEGHPSASAA